MVAASASLEKCDPEQLDSFCQLYTRVVVKQGDGKIQAPPDVKRRLLVNEKLYLKVCPQGA